jgi:streptogramin lyase
MEGIVKEHKAARPMVVVSDKHGNRWLCDKGIDPRKDLAKQGCWQCGDEHFAFTRND